MARLIVKFDMKETHVKMRWEIEKPKLILLHLNSHSKNL